MRVHVGHAKKHGDSYRKRSSGMNPLPLPAKPKKGQKRAQRALTKERREREILKQLNREERNRLPNPFCIFCKKRLPCKCESVEERERRAWRESLALAIKEGNPEIIQNDSYPAWWSFGDEGRRLQAIKEILHTPENRGTR